MRAALGGGKTYLMLSSVLVSTKFSARGSIGTDQRSQTSPCSKNLRWEMDVALPPLGWNERNFTTETTTAAKHFRPHAGLRSFTMVISLETVQ